MSVERITADTPMWLRVIAGMRPDENGCWIWQKRIAPNGYGRLGTNRGRSYYAHRLSYTEFVGPIADGLEIDHLCNVRSCCNPKHLELVTHAENMRRGAERRRAA